MEKLSQKYLLAATIKYATFLSIPSVSPKEKATSFHFSIQSPYACGCRASFPSSRYKNIVDYYYQDHWIKNTEIRTIFPEEGHTALVFRCDLQKPKAFLVGTPTLPRQAEYIISGYDYFIVFFKYGMNFVLYNIYATELTDKYVALDEIASMESKNLVERVVLATSFQERIRVFEQFLEDHMPMLKEVPPQLSHVIKNIRNRAGVMKDENLGIDSLYTDRHIRRLFKKYIGIPPKLYSNIIRHYKALRILSAKPFLDIADLAVALGYYDQSHFIRELKRFKQSTPKQFIYDLSNRRMKI